MIAQRPGFTAPTLLARQLATLDQLYGGRVSLHVITGGNATELRQDGNTLDDKDERYARTSEFLDIVRLEWTSEKPFDYSGKYYKVENGFSQVKPLAEGRHLHLRRRRLRCRDRGRGQACRHFCAVGRILRAGARRHRAGARRGREARPAERRASACRCGRSSPIPRRRPGRRPRRFSRAPPRCRTRPAIASRPMAMRPPARRRLLALAEQGTRIDKRLWTEIAKLTGANSNTTALVGTPEQVAEVFGDYYDLGVSHFLIRGFDPLDRRHRIWPRADPADAQADRRARQQRGESRRNDPALHCCRRSAVAAIARSRRRADHACASATRRAIRRP